MPDDFNAMVAGHFAAADAATSRNEKGRALEDLISYVFGCVPGITRKMRNVLNEFESEEVDIALWNRMYQDGFYFMPQIILVECKNWSQPVGSAEVSWFLSKLERRGLTMGILIAANGITGNTGDISAAHEIIRHALSTIKIIVITRSELQAINSTTDLIDLIENKLCELAVAGRLFVCD